MGLSLAEKREYLALLERRLELQAKNDLNTFCRSIEIPGVPVRIQSRSTPILLSWSKTASTKRSVHLGICQTVQPTPSRARSIYATSAFLVLCRQQLKVWVTCNSVRASRASLSLATHRLGSGRALPVQCAHFVNGLLAKKVLRLPTRLCRRTSSTISTPKLSVSHSDCLRYGAVQTI